jgi:cation:H+ antiporter
LFPLQAVATQRLFVETAFFSLCIGFALLYAGGEALIRGAESVARRLGVPPLLIGLTVVAFATSSPELVVSARAALSGHGDIALGNVVGSNICNIGLILGAAAIAKPLRVQVQLIRIDVPILLVCSLGLFILLHDGTVGRTDAIVMVIALAAYQAFSIRQAKLETPEAGMEIERSLPAAPHAPAAASALVILGLALLVAGGRFFVDGAVALATAAGVSPAVVSLTVVAAGTSLPELAATLAAVVRGHPDMAAGNIIGSCIFNLLGVLGVTALVAPLSGGGIGTTDLIVMTGFSLLLLPLMSTRLSVSRSEGVLMLSLYSAYVLWLAFREVA